MATKLQIITALHEDSLHSIPQSTASWAAFLHTAAHNYKYKFHDQVSIHSQRPDATACATLEVWNKRLDRWINRGAKGIALINTDQTPTSLSYIFDISDTHGRAIPLWQIKPEYEAEITESLHNSYGDFDDDSLADALRSAVSNAVEDNFPDYFHELEMADLFGSYDSEDFKVLLAESVSYMVLTRCGIEAPVTAGLERISSYTYPDAFAQVGAAVSDISETILRDIEATVRNLQKSENLSKRSGLYARWRQSQYGYRLEP